MNTQCKIHQVFDHSLCVHIRSIIRQTIDLENKTCLFCLEYLGIIFPAFVEHQGDGTKNHSETSERRDIMLHSLQGFCEYIAMPA